MRELLHPTLLPGVSAHPAKPRTRGQEQTCQFVTQCSSGAARLGERAAGTCGSTMGKGCIPGKKAAQMAPDGSSGLLQWELPELFWRHPV